MSSVEIGGWPPVVGGSLGVDGLLERKGDREEGLRTLLLAILSENWERGGAFASCGKGRVTIEGGGGVIGKFFKMEPVRMKRERAMLKLKYPILTNRSSVGNSF